MLPSPEDSDGDRLPDEWERRYFANLDRGGNEDPDGDGLDNMQEWLQRTDPTRQDTDGDGYSDAEEIQKNSDPNNRSSVPAPERPPEAGAIIFVPGFAGTQLCRPLRLQPDVCWPTGILRFCDGSLVSSLRPQSCGLDDCTARTNLVEVKSIIRSAYGSLMEFLTGLSPGLLLQGSAQEYLVDEDVYADFSSFLAALASGQGVAFIPFPYDWRLHIDQGPGNPADRLAEVVRPYCERGQRVDIVAHSMGGLVAKAYLAKDKNNERCVRNLITLGTPHYGATKVLKALLFGEDDIVGNFQFLLDKDAAADLLTNMPSAYQLLPSEKISPVFLTQADALGKLDSNATLEALAYEKLVQVLANQNNRWRRTHCFISHEEPLNPNVRAWAGRHKTWDPWRPTDPGLTAYFFAGTGSKTLEKLRYTFERRWWLSESGVVREELTEKGDGTVLASSALAAGLSSDRVKRACFRTRTYCPAQALTYANSTCPTRVVSKDYSHVGMLNEPDLRASLSCILRGDGQCYLPACDGVAARVMRGAEWSAAQEEGEDTSLWLEATLVSEGLDLHVFDGLRNHTGPVAPGLAEREIAGSYYSDSDTTETAVLPYGVTYTIEVHAAEGGVGELTLTRYRGSRPEAVQRYSPISLPRGGVARLAVAELHEEVMVEIDEEDNGNVEEIQAPARLPVADAGEDLVAEKGSVVVVDGMGQLGSGSGPLSYQWTQLSGPPVVLSDPGSPRQEFVVPEVDEQQVILLQLVVNDGLQDSDPDFVSINVLNVEPTTPSSTPTDTATASPTATRTPTPSY